MNSITIKYTQLYLIRKIVYYVNTLKHDTNNAQMLDYPNAKKLMFIPLTKIKVDYKSHKIYILFVETSASDADDDNRLSVILSTDDDISILQEFTNEINSLTPEYSKYHKYLWDGYWKCSGQFRDRKIERLYLPKKDKDLLINSFESFINDTKTKELYKELNIPHKKVCLFYGLPGSGKTSTITALASHFNYKLALVRDITDIDDTDLETMVDILPEKTFLVFEDIDSMFQERESTSFKSGISFSGFLNSIDGVSKTDDTVIFITANNLEKIDSALKRRVDICMEFKHAKKEEIIMMYDTFFPDLNNSDKFYEKTECLKFTISNLEKFLIRCLQEKINPITEIALFKTFIVDFNQESLQLYS